MKNSNAAWFSNKEFHLSYLKGQCQKYEILVQERQSMLSRLLRYGLSVNILYWENCFNWIAALLSEPIYLSSWKYVKVIQYWLKNKKYLIVWPGFACHFKFWEPLLNFNCSFFDLRIIQININGFLCFRCLYFFLNKKKIK